MRIEDYTGISCGGDPFNYILSLLKSLAIDLNPEEIIKIILIKDKFPYDESTFFNIINHCNLVPVKVQYSNEKVSLIVTKKF